MSAISKQECRNLFTTVINGKTQMVAAFDGLSGQLQSAGNFAMQGLTSGINSGAGAAIAAAQRVANAISSTISHALKSIRHQN